jgi:dipeptidyl aminopeptidase/acylaminoacyl peptidase
MPPSLRSILLVAFAGTTAVSLPLQPSTAQGFTVEQVSSCPFPTALTASTTGSRIAWTLNESYEFHRPPRGGMQGDSALAVAWRSSPVASIDRWTSPVLLINADDDRNVRFPQTADLAGRLTPAVVPFEEIVTPDDTHHFMVWENQALMNRAAAEFVEMVLKNGGRRSS